MSRIKESQTANRSATDVAALTFVGRALSFVGRTMALARFGAANVLLNAFTYAFHVPNVLFNTVGTALTTVMIPVYNGLLAENKDDEAKKFINNVTTIALVLLGVLVAVGVAAAPLIARVVGGAGFAEAGYLTFALRILMPLMIFFGLEAIFAGLLQSHGSFRLPALVSAPGGIIIIVYMLFFAESYGVTGLIFITAAGVMLRPLMLLGAVRRLNRTGSAAGAFAFRFSLNLRDKNIRAAGRLCVPVLISVASYQAHFLFAHGVALRHGAAAVMDFAQQLVQVFILILVMAVAAVYFPKLSRLWAARSKNDYAETLRQAFVYTIFLVLPAACGLFLLRYEIMTLLRIDAGADLMGLYAVGITFIAVKEIADRGFYSMQNSKIPAVFGLVIMIVNISAVAILVPYMGIRGIPIAYGAAAIAGVGGLLICLQKKARYFSRRLALELVKILCAAAFMVGVVWAVQVNMQNLIAWENIFFAAALPAIVGAAAYLSAARILRISVVRAKERI